MPHSIEILLDSDTDAAIRDQWHTLEEAGIPNSGQIRAGTVSPHCTLLVGTTISPAADTAVASTAQRLPFTLSVGGALVFPTKNRFILARSVVPSSELLAVHATMFRLADDHVTGLVQHCAPGQWTPHVTLGRRLTAEQVATALDVLSWSKIDGRAARLRRWDSDEKVEVVAPGRAC
ncbi:MAG: 2'-5' RNA ligase family protein [Gordonia sp. (in: high G+C Gram-positive bacteria)]